jgi:hypothetical protein
MRLSNLQSVCYVYCCIVSHVTLLPYVSGCNVRYSLMFRHIHILSYYKLFLYFNLCRETMQHYTQKQIGVKEQIVVRKNMDVNEHETIQHHTQTQIEVKEHMFIYIPILSYYKLFFHFNLCLSVMLYSLSCSFTSICFWV